MTELRQRQEIFPFCSAALFCESLESRCLLSAIHVFPALMVRRSIISPDIQGDTPAQVRKAYGFDAATISSTTTAADGSGQTIAIIDPYNDPTVLSDLNVFDGQFGISPPPSLTVVNQTGGLALPRTDASWAGEIATDVEWAHAIAPGAAILIVEAQSDTTDNLVQAVDYARTVAGVSVVSMSWGGGEFAGQTSYDGDFTTPTGHQGITYVAAAGDNGAKAGAQWPASSPNVLSVGGSVLTLADPSGTYGSETSWVDGSGGYSKFEPEPTWQQVAQRSGTRAMPDVAYNADTNIGLALYDSVPYQGIKGWQTTSGTSVGAPQWAALVAVVDQARAIGGRGTLDGATQTLPGLYNLYGAPGTAAYAPYAASFHDITSPDLGQTAGLPTVGYDIATGLGSPQAAAVISALAVTTVSNPTGPLAPQVSAVFAKPPPLSALSGAAGKLRLRLTNAARTRFAGDLTVTLFASTTPDLAPGATVLKTTSLEAMHLRGRGNKTVSLPFAFPGLTAKTSLYLIASVTQAGGNVSPSVVGSTSATTIAPAFVDFKPAFVVRTAQRIKSRGNIATIDVQNIGNVTAGGVLSVSLYASTDSVVDGTSTLLVTTKPKAIRLTAGKSMKFHILFTPPATREAGSYVLLATVSSAAATSLNVAVVSTVV